MQIVRTSLVLTLVVFALAACGGAPATTDAPVDANPPANVEAVATDTAPATNVEPVATEETSDAAPTTGELMSTEQTSGGLPLYAGATAVEDNAILTTMLDAMKEQLAQQDTGANVHVDAYGLAGDADFAAVKDFYDSYLTGEGWTELTDAAQIQEGVETAGWSKGDNTAVVVMVMPDPMNAANKFLIISHAEAE